MEKPLAERMRPKKLSEVVGQEHLLGHDKLITKLVKAGQPFSLILWGPPGSGKTTLARIIASELDADFIELSAVTAGKSDVSLVIERAKRNAQLPGTNGSISTNVLPLDSPTAKPFRKTVLFVDEIHRFNKAQQDTFFTARRVRLDYFNRSYD